MLTTRQAAALTEAHSTGRLPANHGQNPRIINNLVNRGLLAAIPENDHVTYEITSEGRRELSQHY